MSKPTLLIADADPRSLGILEVALRKAGFAVATVADGAQALKRIHDSPPDLAVLDAALPSKDGIKLCKALRADEKLSAIPVLIIGAEKSLAAKAIEAGADDFLAKPIVLKELAQRAQMLIQRRQQNEAGAEAPLTGSVRDLGLLDLFQQLLAAGKSAVVMCEAYGREARVWVKEGQIIDAEFGALQGDGAFWRLMTWESGSFRAEFGKVEREWRIEGGTQAALVKAMRKVEEVSAASGELPMTTQLAIDYGVLAEALADLPDEVNGVIRCFDGKRTLRESLDQSPSDDLSTLAVVRKLLGDGILKAVESKKQALPGKPSLNQWLAADATPAPPKSLDEARAAAALVREMAQAESVALQRAREKDEAAAVAVRPLPAPVKPVAVVHFPPLRGVRRERLRREAEEARARIGEGKPLRLAHLVELPPRGEAEALGEARRMSPAVGEAAKKFAPDAPVARLVNGSPEPAQRVEPKTEPAQPVVTPPIAPVAVPTPVPPSPIVDAIVPGTPPPDRALEAALLQSVQKRKRRWPLYSSVALALLAAAWFLRPQPLTDKQDAPWLEAKAKPPPVVQQVPRAPPQVVTPPQPPPPVAVAAIAPPPPPDSDDVYATALQQGDELLKRGKYKASITQFQRAVKEKPRSVPALLALGDAYLEADKPRSAVQPLETAARLDAQSARAQLLLGTAYQSLGRNAAAVKAYQRYLELEPSGEFIKDVRLILANLAHSG